MRPLSAAVAAEKLFKLLSIAAVSNHPDQIALIEKAFQDAEDRGAARERQRWVRTRKVA